MIRLESAAEDEDRLAAGNAPAATSRSAPGRAKAEGAHAAPAPGPSAPPTDPTDATRTETVVPCRVMALDTHAAVKTLTDAGADEALAVAVVEVAREASTEATGELVTRAHFDTALAQLESRLAWRLVTAGHRDRGRGCCSAAVPRVNLKAQSICELLALHAALLEELRARGVLRSENNPTGDLAEYLFCSAYGWQRYSNSEKALDATGEDGTRYQIKGQAPHAPQSVPATASTSSRLCCSTSFTALSGRR